MPGPGGSVVLTRAERCQSQLWPPKYAASCELTRNACLAPSVDIIDVFGWGALGHAFAYAVLAISSLHNYGVNPWPSV